MERKHTFVYGIKGKLISAVAMLLVAVIMVVSSTYAWFTLSTAPEVTGITTNIGANGALEIALTYAGSTPLDTVLPQGASTELRNTYWGNLVDLSGSTYGLDQITINPSQLIYTTSGGIDFTKGVLQIPVYGADGRVSELAANSSVGMFQNGSFIPVTDNVTNASGVRAIGLSSGLTDRQLAYRNARSAAINATAAAVKAAGASLQINGSGMANIAVKHALSTDGADTYNANDKAALQGVVTDLKGVIAYIEEAYVQYIYALAASNANTEAHYQAIKLWVESGSMTFDAFMTAAETTSDPYNAAASAVLGKDTGGKIQAGYDALQITKTSLTSAQTKIDNLTGASYSWDAISAPLNDLVKYSGITVNGMEVTNSGIKSHVINSFTKQGLNVEMSTGNGLYADIADHCGSYSAQIKIENVDVGLGEPLDVDAVLKANSNLEYLNNVGDVVTGAGSPATGTDASKPISEFYGYILDFVFRTNAAGSNLLLQTAPVDRIYNEKGEESLTWGHGSTMQFTKTAADYSLKQMVELMSAIRIVFFNPADGSVFATAKLDMSYVAGEYVAANGTTPESFGQNAKFEVIGNDTIKAQVKVCTTLTYFYANGLIYTVNGAVPSDSVASYTKVGNDYFDNDGTKVTDADLADSLKLAPATHVLKGDGKYYATAAPDTAITDVATISNLTNLPEDQKNTVENIIEDKATIKALAQNSIEAVSTLVYLDGQFVKNSSVAASGTASVTGKLNLQFSSSAALTPMNYSGFDNMFNGRVTKGTTSLALPAEKTYRLVDATNWSGDVTDLNGLAAPATGWSVNGTTLTIPADAAVGTKVIALVVDGENTPTGEYYTIEIISAPAQSQT